MTSANSIEARRQLALGRSKMSLDTAAALKHLDAAVAADESDGEARAARARARLASGDATGALQDADAATRLAPRLADGWAVRAEAKRALGRAEAELIEDYAEAARLDPSFKDAFEALVAKASAGGAQNADARNVAGRSAPDDLRGPMTRLPAAVRKYGLISSIAAIALILGGALFLMKRSDGDGAPRG
ncbi:MAG: hypothetical protein M0D55_01870 [Elusimicrobiota bacterium]|nr:MAG: hypothetical protein M0D55_01870 [Elusimicrobiota bacterium]